MTKNMTLGSPSKALFLFALPMVLGNIFQQMYNIADSVIVGKFVSANALAAVGATTSITFLFISVATGSGIGASIIISQLFGARQISKLKTAVYTALISVFILGLLILFTGIFLSPAILRLMRTPEIIFRDSLDYLHIYFLGIVFLFMYNTVNAIFNALGESGKTLLFLILSSVLNVLLDLLFVLKFNMAVKGVAIATLISQGVCAVISFIFLIIRLRQYKENKDFSYFNIKTLKNIAMLAVPSILQQSTVSLGLIMVQSLVNNYGSVFVAGYTAATKIDSIAIMPMVNVGSAMSTFTAQHIGAKKTERIPHGFKTSLIMIAVISIIIAVSVFIWGDRFVGAFVNRHDTQVILIGVEYLKVVSVFYIVMGAMNICNGVLRGAGDMRSFLTITFINHITRVFFAYLGAVLIGAAAIWWALPSGWFVSLVLSYIIYKKGSWRQRSLV